MVWGQIAGAIAGPVAGSLMGNLLNRGERREANQLSNQAIREGERSSSRAEDFARMSRERYQFFLDFGQPLDLTIIQEAMAQYHEGVDADVARATADVNTAHDRAEAIRTRQQSRYGEIDPNSGAEVAGRRQAALARASDEVNTRQRARLAAEATNYNRLLGASDVGRRGVLDTAALGRVEEGFRGTAADIFTGGAIRAADSASGISQAVGNIAARVPWEEITDQIFSGGEQSQGPTDSQPGFNYADNSGYAQGGVVSALPMPGPTAQVAGKQIVGPGTGTSDSVPAVVDGHQPAALSSGEFVIPAEVVRRKGTEFFEKMIRQTMQPQGAV